MRHRPGPVAPRKFEAPVWGGLVAEAYGMNGWWWVARTFTRVTSAGVIATGRFVIADQLSEAEARRLLAQRLAD